MKVPHARARQRMPNAMIKSAFQWGMRISFKAGRAGTGVLQPAALSRTGSLPGQEDIVPCGGREVNVHAKYFATLFLSIVIVAIKNGSGGP
jgi:hypothetical protein